MSYNTPSCKDVRSIKKKNFIKWEDGRDELSRVFNFEYIISKLNHKVLYDNKQFLVNICKVYDMCNQSPPNNYSGKIYDYFIVYKSNELINYVNSFINDHLDNIDIQNPFKLCVKWNLYRRIAIWISKLFSYLDRFYTRPEKIQKVLDRLYNNFMERYNVSESDIELYEEEWKQLYKARQRLQLSKIITYDIPYDLYDIISRFVSEKNITRKILFKSINIEIDDESRKKKNTFCNIHFKLL